MTTAVQTSRRIWRASFAVGALFLLFFQGLPSTRAERHEPRKASGAITGTARVVDGDTIAIGSERIRLEGIDAPETAQSCRRADGSAWACGRTAARALAKLVAGREITCEGRGYDKYGRLLAICFAGRDDINATMVRSGYAWAFVRYSNTYVAEEREARQRLAGIWQGRSEPPWSFRHNGWNIAERRAPEGCAIKGNVSHNGRVYHMPWSQWYERVTIDEARGEKWFCSEADAIAAGWRPARSY